MNHHVRIDISGSGIRYVPGSHVGILYESRPEEVHNTLLALADGDLNKAKMLGDTMIGLNPTWIGALQHRQQYNYTTSSDDPRLPRRLELRTFLKWGELRPASRKMLEMAYRASHSTDIRKILDSDLASALTFAGTLSIDAIGWRNLAIDRSF